MSQRYVSGRVLRFVERPEYQGDPELHDLFTCPIDQAFQVYHQLAESLLARQQHGTQILSADAKTDLRKKVQRATRSVLPNETEALLVTTVNARAWRFVVAQRGSVHAETEIRALAVRAFLCLGMATPILFQDMDIVQYVDGTWGLTTTHQGHEPASSATRLATAAGSRSGRPVESRPLYACYYQPTTTIKIHVARVHDMDDTGTVASVYATSFL